MASPPGASRSFPGGWTGARLVASHPNHRRENYVLRAVPRNPAPPAAFLPPSPVASTRTSGMSARAMQIVSGVCKRIGSYLRRAQDVGDRGARALRRGFTCLLLGPVALVLHVTAVEPLDGLSWPSDSSPQPHLQP